MSKCSVARQGFFKRLLLCCLFAIAYFQQPMWLQWLQLLHPAKTLGCKCSQCEFQPLRLATVERTAPIRQLTRNVGRCSGGRGRVRSAAGARVRGHCVTAHSAPHACPRYCGQSSNVISLPSIMPPVEMVTANRLKRPKNSSRGISRSIFLTWRGLPESTAALMLS